MKGEISYFLHISHDNRDIVFLAHLSRKARYHYFLHIFHDRQDIVFLAHLSRKARYRISRTSLSKGGMYYFLYLSLKRRDVYNVTCFLDLS
jgi:hypothetical protein